MVAVKAQKKKALPKDRAELLRKKLVTNTRSLNSVMGYAYEETNEQSRDFNKECGYPEQVTLDLMDKMYQREGVAQRVVHVYPVETWKTSPSVYSTKEEKQTSFEKAVEKIVERFNIWAVLERADRLSGIGCYGVILLGVNDGRKLHKPVQGVKDDSDGAILKARTAKNLDLTYIRVFDQRQVTILRLETDNSSPRYGKPVLYGIKMMNPADALISPVSSEKETTVHWTRIVHLADNRQSSEIAGVPRLEPAYNRIIDLLKVLGGAGEMFWKGGFPGLSFQVQPGLGDIDFDPELFRRQIDEYAKGLQRYLRVVGIEVKSLAPQVADPTAQVDAALDQICITINCPKRIFLGTESAHLASTQDQKTWSDRINGRRSQYAVPYIIKPFFRRLMQMGVIPFVDEFFVDWVDAEEVDPLVRAQAFEKLVNGISQYCTSGMASLYSPLMFLTHILQVPLVEAELILEAAKQKDKAVELVLATDEMKLKEETARAGLEAKKLASKGSGKPGTAGTAPAGKSGRKPGTGKRRESKAVSTGQRG
jgi:hypothetical protein